MLVAPVRAHTAMLPEQWAGISISGDGFDVICESQAEGDDINRRISMSTCREDRATGNVGIIDGV